MTPEELLNWFDDHPPEIAVAFAVRAAARVWPLTITDSPLSELPEPAFSSARVLLTANALGTGTTGTALRAALDADFNAGEQLAVIAAAAARWAASSAAWAEADPHRTRDFARTAVDQADKALTSVAGEDGRGAAILARFHDSGLVSKAAFPQRFALWSGVVNPLKQQCATARAALKDEPAFEFWLRWYQSLLSGYPLKPDMLRAIALIPPDDWDKGPAHVAEMIAAIELDHARRATNRPGDRIVNVDQGKQSPVRTASFSTRARTVDHLGREQIADCPTAVSELWKNAWDAYARRVVLRVYDEEPPIAALTDDGHGMREPDFYEKWLVIGTESKVADKSATPPGDRNKLPVRPRQGQKGIGRLSSAKLGPVLLLITKHRKEDYLAALIDWRLFENPYINLSDVTVATGRFGHLEEVFAELAGMADTLAQNVASNVDGLREQNPKRQEGWELYDEEWRLENLGNPSITPSTRILQSLKRLPFRLDHLGEWTGPGTAMLVFEIDDDLKSLPRSGDTDAVEDTARQRFTQTLSSFIDPYSTDGKRPDFSYRAEVCRSIDGASSRSTVIVGAEKAIDRTQVQEMEHQLEGTVGSDGVFRGRIKAFGVWIDGRVTFDVPNGVRIPDRANSRVGEFDVFIASMEFEPENSTHSRAEHVSTTLAL